MKTVSLVLFYCFSTFFVLGQNDVSQYLDDGKFSSTRGELKMNVLATACGDLALTYEFFISKNISIESSVGILLPHGVEYFNAGISWADDWIYDRDGGYSLRISPRIKADGIRQHGWISGLDFLYRQSKNYRNTGVERKEMSYMFYGGYKFPYTRRVTFEGGYSIGVTQFNDAMLSFMDSGTFLEGNTRFEMIFSLKVGYIL